VLVCRKREEDAPVATRRDFINTLKRELKPELAELQRSNIAPVDLAQAIIGPGMSVYSRYSRVLEADGNPMSVREALKIINKTVDEFSEQEGELDRDSRFCIGLYQQYGFDTMPFGMADELARSKNTSVQKLAESGVLSAEKGKVSLLSREVLPEVTDTKESMVWLLTQQLTCAFEKGGVDTCAEIIIKIIGSGAEDARVLAYRLYTIAERKGWTDEAFAYNALVVAWPDIQKRAAELRDTTNEQITF
jgi:putative DNA methylase